MKWFDVVEEAFKMEPLVWDSEPALLYTRLDDPRAMPRLIGVASPDAELARGSRRAWSWPQPTARRAGLLWSLGRCRATRPVT